MRAYIESNQKFRLQTRPAARVIARRTVHKTLLRRFQAQVDKWIAWDVFMNLVVWGFLALVGALILVK